MVSRGGSDSSVRLKVIANPGFTDGAARGARDRWVVGIPVLRTTMGASKESDIVSHIL